LAKITKKNEFLEKNLRDFKGRYLHRLKHEYKLSYEEVVELLTKAEQKLKKKEILIPISVFDNKELSAFETLCKYLKEELKFSYHKSAILLRRDDHQRGASDLSQHNYQGNSPHYRVQSDSNDFLVH